MNDQQGQIPQWPQYQSGNISSQQHTQHPQYVIPPVPDYVSPQQSQWPPSHYPQQPPSQPLSPQLMQPFPPQMTNKIHTKKKIGFITVSAIILTLIFVLGIAVGANLKGSSNPGLPPSTSIPSTSSASSNTLPPTQEPTSPPTPIPTPIQMSPAKVGDTITDNNIVCTLISVKLLPDDGIIVPKAGDIFIVVHIKLINKSSIDFQYYDIDFKGKSGSGNTTDPQSVPPSTYTANNLIDTGTLSPGGTQQGDIVIEVPGGDHKAELVWQPGSFINSNTTDNLWNLGL